VAGRRGYSLLLPEVRERILAAKAIAVGGGCTVSFDPGAYQLLAEHVGGETLLEACEDTDVLLPNEAEALALAGAKSIEEAADRLGVRSSIVCIKRGPAGCLLVTAAGRMAVASSRSAVADTTGVGDAFAAGFLAAWKRGAPPREAASAGMRAATRAVSRVGAGPEGEP
jgi:sugar/nucleoside kinase (ribokinase family)